MPQEGHLSGSHTNQYSTDAVCGHCDRFSYHEHWCITQNTSVRYAYQTVADPGLLSLGDHLILHALGVAWTKRRTLSRLLHS
jgi:hypothetical protein